MKSFLRPALLAALVCVSLAVPLRADERPKFPMQANAYRPIVQKRITAVWTVIERKLDAHNVSADRKKQIRAMLDDAAKGVWAEYGKAAADGTITRDEDQRLRGETRTLRSRVRAKMAAERSGDAGKVAPVRVPAPPSSRVTPPRPETSSRPASSASARKPTKPPGASSAAKPSRPPSTASARRPPPSAPKPKPAPKERDDDEGSTGVLRPPGAEE